MKKYSLFFLTMCAGLVSYHLFFNKKYESFSQLTTQIDVPPTQEAADLSLPQRTIRLENRITKKMISYRYLGKKHLPNEFGVTVNNREITAEEPLEITIVGNELDVTYNYSFAKGLYKGKKTNKISLDPEKNSFALTFSWKSEPKIRIQEV